MPNTALKLTELRAFDQSFDTTYEDSAATARGEFLQSFPQRNLKNLTLENYVIGLGSGTFCYGVEVQTKSWANITGATASKFGIYYGKIKSDPNKRYRSNVKFGRKKEEAFENVKAALLELLLAGEKLDFQAITENPLSQMLKAKVLSLYFPMKYLNVCSADHLAQIASELGLEESRSSSEYQHLLLQEKNKSAETKSWSNPKFMSFLYQKYIYENLEFVHPSTLHKPRKVRHKKVNFEDLLNNRDEIGRKSEEYAIAWEKKRLIGLGHDILADRIEDRREYPSYGYDFRSFTGPLCERYVEVKSLGYDRKEKCYRFFLSENEFSVSNSALAKGEYYFYLVKYGNDGEPQELFAEKAEKVYAESELLPCAYIVRTTLRK
jgi:Domain of unknown function (DUF3883)